MSECIHGLDSVLCDVCSPKPAVVAAPAPRRAPVARKAPSLRSSSPRTTRPAEVPKQAFVKPSEQRIFHVTHMDNLPRIIDSGAILPPALGANPEVDLSAATTREERSAVSVDGVSVAELVPFFVSPDSFVWSSIRSGLPDPRLSEAREMPAAEFVVLALTIGTIGFDSVIVADADAGAPGTRFYSDAGSAEIALRRMLEAAADDEENEQIRRAEVLVRGQVPFESIALVSVASMRVRDSVRELLAEIPHSPKVAVHPPWFVQA